MATVITENRSGMRLGSLLARPETVLFLSANTANAANLVFNMAFARLMGPELFADLALLVTFKLAALLIFSALQLGFAKLSVDKRLSKKAQSHAVAQFSQISFGLCIPVCFVLIIFVDSLAELFKIADSLSVLLLILAIPALIPLNLYRGLALGRLDVSALVYSLQSEWILRLFGGLLLWWAGAGLTGVVVALVASVYLATLCTSRRADRQSLFKRNSKSSVSSTQIFVASVPFLAIQCAQTFILDGELILAKFILPAEEVGFLAALLLVQRIFFFAFISFSTLLLPLVAKKTLDNDIKGARRDLMRLLSALIGLSVIPIMVLAGAGGLIVNIMFGADFAPIAHLLPITALNGLAFTLTHLIVTYKIAQGSQAAAYAFTICSAIQFIGLSICLTIWPSLEVMVSVKFIFLVLLFLLSIAHLKFKK